MRPLILGLSSLLVGSAAMAADAHEFISTMPGGYAVSASPPAGEQPQIVSQGWQPKFLYEVPPGTVSLFFHFPCPTQFPIVHNGAFAFSANNGNQTQVVYLQYNGPRLDEKPTGYGEWGWHFFWPSGSPNPTSITFAPECYAAQ